MTMTKPSIEDLCRAAEAYNLKLTPEEEAMLRTSADAVAKTRDDLKM